MQGPSLRTENYRNLDISSADKVKKWFRIPANLPVQYDLHWNRGVPALQILCFVADCVWDQYHITELNINWIIKAGFLQVYDYKNWWVQTENCHKNGLFF